MTLRHLRIFVEVVKCGKMSETAAKLFISQSSISQTIAELESYYGVKLFDRLSKRLFLTSCGKELYEMASKVIMAYDEMDQYMEHISDKQEFRVGATFTIGATVMTRILKQLDKESATIATKVVVDRTSVLENLILHGELDAALVEGTVKSHDLIVRPLVQDELFLVCAPTHPFAQKKSVALKDLDGEDFIMREPTSKTRLIFESYLERAGVAVAEKWVCNNLETIKSAVMAGYGLSVLSERYIKPELEKKALVAVAVKGVHMVRDFSLVYHKNKYPFPAFQKFLSICEDFAE